MPLTVLAVEIPRTGERVLIARTPEIQMEVWAAHNAALDLIELFTSLTDPEPIGIGAARTSRTARDLARMFLREMEPDDEPYFFY
ncbi:hypothetical protein QTI33_32240 [Variovorax sp. J22P271]|uniref:hypothetical protein n=1 Tax=Variovorax davisae TaxID=3053515 RepID=UPI0025753AAE|nr:hypothetical protein [Variovorax sp. J22P271]MDM0036844.1 hypothetical protein [Variovorax sp. J22P271]